MEPVYGGIVRLAWLLAVPAAGALLVGASFAQGPNVRADPDQVTAGQDTSVDGFSFPCTTVRVFFDKRQFATEPVTSQAFSADLTVPADTPAGDYEVSATCTSPVDNPPTASATLKVTSPPTLTLTPNPARPGATVTVSGTGFDECTSFPLGRDGSAPIPVRLSLADRQLDPTTVSAGTFRTSFPVPPDMSPGSYTLTATCSNSYLPGETTRSTTLTVASAPQVITSTPVTSGSGSGSGGSGSGGSGSGGGISQAPSTSGSGSWVPGAAIALVVGLAGLGLFTRAKVRRTAAVTAPPIPMPRSPQQAQRLPDVRARAVASPPAVVEVRRTGRGRDVALRLVGRTDPGVQTIRFLSR